MIMKNQLKTAFKPMPERFRYTIASAIAEAEQTANAKRRIATPVRAVIAVVLILAVVPSAVFGASKLIGLFAKPVGEYGVALSIEPQSEPASDYPEYVTMHVTVPEAFAEVEGTDGLKYHRAGDTDYSSGFSLFPMRYSKSNLSEVIANVDSYEEITLCGHSAYRVNMLGEGVYDRLYISYDDVNVTLLVFYSRVSEEELSSFVSGIRFTEGTASDHTELGEPFDERVKDKVIYTFNYRNIELPRDTVFTCKSFSEKTGDDSLRYTVQLTDVHVSDSISGFENARINRMYMDGSLRFLGSERLADESGKLLPRTITVTKGGDGFSATDEVISKQEMEQCVILFDLTYTNLSDEETLCYIPYSLDVLNRSSDGSLAPASDVDPQQNIYSDRYCDPEMLYNSDPADSEKLFYCTSLGPYQTKTVTIGFRCSTNMLDRAYLTVQDVNSSEIIEPACPVEDDAIPNYIIKVQ